MEEERVDVNIDVYPALLITLTFIFLKCGGVIDWNWLWVCTPIFVYIGIALIFIAFVLIEGIISDHRNGGNVT